MTGSEFKHKKKLIVYGFFLICFGLSFPLLSQHFWFGISDKIRYAIKSGDSGYLILAAAAANFLNSIQSIAFFLGSVTIITHLNLNFLVKLRERAFISILFIIFLNWLGAFIYNWRWEFMTVVATTAVSLFLFEKIFRETHNFLQVSIVSIQVFFALHWLNIMPLLENYQFGRSDIPLSIKTAGKYLNAYSVLDFAGFAFFLPFIISAFVTAALFISYSRHIKIIKENHEKERKLQYLKVKVLENRIYQELHSLVHDLKTPLVTIRGLNSLLAMTNSDDKRAQEYFSRIENSVNKMNEMISGILYESARQKIKVSELINYVRAQLPLEDESIEIDICIDKNLPVLYVNKIRVARAIINLLENAILAPCKYSSKKIRLEVTSCSNGILIKVQDNCEGIKESDLHRIWEAGYTTRNTSGLGLPFVKQVVESHNGWIDIKSKVGQGTTVILFLPSILEESKNCSYPTKGNAAGR